MLQQVADNLWTRAIPRKFMGWNFGARMTVVRLDDGGVWVHSPLPLDDELREATASLGPVAHIVAPNKFHHLYVGDWGTAWPQAELWGARGLEKKRKDLRFTGLLEDASPSWADEIEPISFAAAPHLGENVFVHRGSGTLIVTDTLQNLHEDSHWWTKAYLRFSDMNGKVGLSKVLRPGFDKKRIRPCLDALQERTWDRIIVAHGDIVQTDARQALEQAYAWAG